MHFIKAANGNKAPAPDGIPRDIAKSQMKEKMY